MRSKIFTRTVGYWPLQESSGQAYDYSGNENHATSTNVSSYGVSGPLGSNAMEFDGDNDSVDLPIDLKNSSQLSLSAWAKIDSYKDQDDAIVGQHDSDGNNAIQLVARDGSEQRSLAFRVKHGGTWYNAGNASQAIGEWVFLTGVYDGTKLYFYVNGELIGTTSYTEDFSQNNGDFKLATWEPYTSNYFDGKIAHVRVWDYPLPEASIKALYNASKGGFSESDSKTL